MSVIFKKNEQESREDLTPFIKDKPEKWKEKKVLLDEVKSWILGNDKEAKEEFKESAHEVINVLKKISKELKYGDGNE